MCGRAGPSNGKKPEELIAEKVAKELIAEEDGKKKEKAKKARVQEEARRAEIELKAKEKRKVEQAIKAKQECNVEKKHKSATPKQTKQKDKNQQPEFSSSCVIETAQPLLSASTQDSVTIYSCGPDYVLGDPTKSDVQVSSLCCSEILSVSTSSNLPIVPVAPIQGPEIEAACANCVAESQFVQNWEEPENPQDQLFEQFNCVVDLSRGVAGPWYQCKIFFYSGIGLL